MIEKLLLNPIMTAKIFAMKRDIYRKIGSFRVEAYLSDEPIPRSQWEDLDFKPFPKGKHWTHKKFGCALFRLSGLLPEEEKGRKIVALLKLGAEAQIYENGRAICSVTPIMATIDVGQPLLGKQVVPLTDCLEGCRKAELIADCGHNGYCGVFLYDPRMIKADIAVVDEEKKDFYYDCLTALLTLATRGKNDALTDDGIKEIERLFDVAYALYKKGDIAEARKVMAPLFAKNLSGVEYTAIGHGHLDLAWKWPLREGRRKAVRTFSNVADFLDRGYEFVFGASQAQMFKWVEEGQPELFERIKGHVERGGIELQGGMWTECDCNVPCGESLVRQFMYGEKYFQSRFGKSSDVVWLPDAFGFPYTLPQIIAGVGKKYFMTVKLNWNEYNRFPYQSFKWIGPDGSGVIAHMAPEGTYACSASPIAFVKGDNRNVQKETGAALLIYGVSDGGGGPGEGHLEVLKRAGGRYAPRAVAGSSEGLFRKLERATLPRYDGELYLEKHQGTLTSQAKNKYFNRLAERKLHVLEWLECVTGEVYAEKDGLWERLLTNQFHDILPGSSIERVHRESVEELECICGAVEEEIGRRIKSLGKGNALCALNPSPFYAEKTVVYDGQCFKARVKPYSAAELIPCDAPGCFVARKNRLENERIRVVFNDYGEISSVTDKRTGREYAGGLLHALRIYGDPKGKYDAWDIDRKYLRRAGKRPVLEKLTFTEQKDCARAIAHYTFGKSTITQEITIRDTETIYFNTQAVWNETHKMLRADFRPAVWSEKACFDIQFGSVERSTADKTDEEKARYEVCGHYYAAVGDGENGYAAVMSTGKYGYRVKDGLISLNLLRSPTFPDETCDKGEQFFSYAVVFADSLKTVVSEAYNYNNPIILTDGRVVFDAEYGIEGEGIITETVKLAESGDGVVVRAYERFGAESAGRIIMPEGCEAFETDMLERPKGKTALTEIKFNPHEIKTVLIKSK